MTASVWAWLAAAGVLAVLDWVAVAKDARLLERCAKPAALGCLLIAAAVASPHRPQVHGWLIAALVCCLVGDLVLAFQSHLVLDYAVLIPAGRFDGPKVPRQRAEAEVDGRSDRLFLLGLSSFLVGLLCYAVAMQRYGTDQLSVGFGLILALIALFAFGYKIIAGACAAGGVLLTIGTTAYIVALGSAVVLGIGTTQLWIAYGIVLFAVSDLVLASDRFVQARPWAPVTVIVTYHLAQGLLLIGLLR
ncbi:MAG: lysoplasmalogenase [Actinomycetota bacterium]|nr:lysoplasmalogenase [Actinomycetota bacterium]MDQ2957579.1 lysoplasmalogenase [Actinomycetota bacterium]